MAAAPARSSHTVRNPFENQCLYEESVFLHVHYALSAVAVGCSGSGGSDDSTGDTAGGRGAVGGSSTTGAGQSGTVSGGTGGTAVGSGGVARTTAGARARVPAPEEPARWAAPAPILRAPRNKARAAEAPRARPAAAVLPGCRQDQRSRSRQAGLRQECDGGACGHRLSRDQPERLRHGFVPRRSERVEPHPS